MAVALPVPQTIPQLWVVLHDDTSHLGGPGDALAAAWVRERVGEPLARHLQEFLRDFVRFVQVPRSEVPCPPVDVLRYLGLGAEEEALLHNASQAVVISGADLPAPPRTGYWAGLCAARALAEGLGGIVLDPDQRRIRPIDEHTESPPATGVIRIQQHILVPTSRTRDGTWWVTTLGMGRFGLPNLEIPYVPEGLVPEAHQLIHTAAQALVEGLECHALADLPLEVDVLEVGTATMVRALDLDEQAGGCAEIGLSWDETQDREPMIQLHPPRRPGPAEVGAWLVASLDALELAGAP